MRRAKTAGAIGLAVCGSVVRGLTRSGLLAGGVVACGLVSCGLSNLPASADAAGTVRAGGVPQVASRPIAGPPIAGPPIAGRRVVIAFVASREGAPRVLARLGAEREIEALGLLDPSDGNYNEQQALLDLTQSARISSASYTPTVPPAITVSEAGRASHWPAVLRRARNAVGEIMPGLFAASVPGGVAYAGASARPGADAIVAADRHGRVAAISLGSPGSLTSRTAGLLARHLVVVVEEPGFAGLASLLAARSAAELAIVLEQPPRTTPSQQTGPQLLAIGVSGLPGSGAQLTTETTRRPGLVTGLDVAPTALSWLGLAAPAGFTGHPITTNGRRSVGGLQGLDARLGVISGRRWPTIETFLAAWLVLVLSCALLGRRRGLRTGMRLGGLAALWTPCTMLVTAALAPSRAVEVAIIVGGAFALAVATDRLARWPRGPAVPAAAMVLVYGIDLALGSPLIARSLLGSNPIAGARFYGVGNEMEAALPIILFAGLAAALPQRPASRREAVIFAGAGLLFTAVIAWGRLGADVGALFTIGGGTAAGTLVLRRTRSRGALLLTGATPFIGLAGLAGLDLLTSAGGHYTNTILHAGSVGDVLDTVNRKLDSAWRQLRHGVMPIDTAICLAAGAYVIRNRDRILAPTGKAAGWRACLVAGFTGSILGSLTNDSGPVLLVIGCFGLACVLAYVRGDPRLAET
jgi:hypothetical protein